MVAEAVMPFFIARLLGKADVGALSSMMLVYGTLSVVLTAGFPAAILYFLADRRLSERAAVVRRILGRPPRARPAHGGGPFHARGRGREPASSPLKNRHLPVAQAV